MKTYRLATALFLSLGLAALGSAEVQFIARMTPGTDPRTIASTDGVILRDQTANAPFALFASTSDAAAPAAQAKLQADPKVLWVNANGGYTCPVPQAGHGGSLSAIGTRNDLQTLNSNVLQQVDWSPTLAASSGRKVTVAILDTGLSPNQPYLWAKVDSSANFVTPGQPAYDAPTTDSNGNTVTGSAVGHGTMVTGLVDMVAPQVRFSVAKVADSNGNATAWALIQGLAFAVSNHAEVANISLGSATPVPALTGVASWCSDNGLLIVAAIGNGASSGAWYPAKISNVLCVAGLNPDNTKASFSNWDTKTSSSCPATGITVQWWTGTLGIWSGTSFAAPFVTGAVSDCLRRTTPIPGCVLINGVKKSGMGIDSINSPYAKALGTLLDIQALDSWIKKGCP